MDFPPTAPALPDKDDQRPTEFLLAARQQRRDRTRTQAEDSGNLLVTESLVAQAQTLQFARRQQCSNLARQFTMVIAHFRILAHIDYLPDLIDSDFPLDHR